MFLCKSLVYRYGTTILCKGDDFMIFCDKTRVDKEQNTPFHLDLFRLQGGESNSCISVDFRIFCSDWSKFTDEYG